MCGIAGIALKPNQLITEFQKQALLNALAHRGPDGQGSWQNDGVVLLHTRLAIIDVDGGKQPLFKNDQLALVVNGEIYNSPELREDFKDYTFQTGSDCEAILPLWQKFHQDFPVHLRGMYGIALVDVDKDTVILSRDPFGIKPLYYSCIEAGVVFASEPQAILKANFIKPVLHEPAIQSLLQLQFSVGKQTVYQGISKLMPGETLIIQKGEIVHRQQTSFFQKDQKQDQREKITDEIRALRQLDELLEDSVRLHERSDVPFGLFLSSGVDSTILLKMMQRLGREKQLHAWTARFDTGQDRDSDKDESQQAALMAKQVGAMHHVLTITRQQVWQDLPKIIACMDDPVADYAIIPSWFLAREASQQVKVILSGEGGDELFAGYGRYRKAAKPWWLGGKSMYRKGIFEKSGLLRKPFDSWNKGLWTEAAQDYEFPMNSDCYSRLQQAQGMDIATWLPDDLLIKLDRCLMVHGVEGRVPFLDKRIAEFSETLSDSLKVRKGQGKWLLRQWLQINFPQSRPFARKSGFTVPIGRWIEQDASQLAPLVANQVGIQEITFADRLLMLFEKASGRKERFMAWNLLFYALWHQIHVMGKASQGTIAEVLAG